MATPRRRLTPIESALRKVAALLDRARARWAVVGGLGVSARAEPRFTRDVDLALSVADDGEAEALVHRLVSAGFRVIATMEQRRTGRLATVRLRAPGERSSGIVVDLLFASSGIEREIVDAAEVLEVFPRIAVPVARTGHLIAMKLLARDDRSRPQDIADLRALTAMASGTDLDTARQAVREIAARGSNRGKDLPAALRRLLRGRRSGAARPRRREGR